MTVFTTKRTLFLLLFLIVVTTVLGRGLNLTECKEKLNASILTAEGKKYRYNKALRGAVNITGANSTVYYTEEGCGDVCGGDYALYTWPKIAETITTWVLPAVGLMLQAPYESNVAIWGNVYLIVRWLGSPVASLTCTLWNISVTGKCALLVDMATEYRPPADLVAAPDSVFAQIRDSFYLLSVLNQYTFQGDRESEQDLERLLRFALFDPSPKTVGLRQRLATSLRRQRRRGVVQVMITLFWFVVALIISIHRAFGEQLGNNATAHDLALGLLLGWFPILLASTVIDRNPTDAVHTRRKLNSFLLNVQKLNPDKFIHAFDPARENVFEHFAGQGRLRWHYGAAHCILNTLEDDFLKDAGPCTPRSSPWSTVFDIRQLWQAGFSWLLLATAFFSAFWISYNTPTVGLGCRSGGDMIFGIIATTSTFLELSAWPFLLRLPAKLTRALHTFLILVETTNTVWLSYVICAQTFGIYNSCSCLGASWGGGGGYVDFEGTNFYKDYYAVGRHWAVGTVVGMLCMSVGIGYVLEQWMTQSFLWSSDYDKVMRGLGRTRRWKRWTVGVRRLGRWMMDLVRWRRVDGEYRRVEGRSVRWES
ncbi:hypothetical protein K440DRAFT_652913 [Wilcoxina mikolae CBS 423.85]|nr:hypothetical protein K440DRAFT_652913 [Wilcoxina mikolae CBS 423.85]